MIEFIMALIASGGIVALLIPLLCGFVIFIILFAIVFNWLYGIYADKEQERWFDKNAPRVINPDSDDWYLKWPKGR